MNIQERTESINNAVKKLADFVQTNDAVKNDFNEYIRTIGANNPNNRISLQAACFNYILERNLGEDLKSIPQLFLENTKRLNKDTRNIIEAIDNSISSVFEVKRVEKHVCELYNIVNKRKYMVTSLMKMTALSNIGSGNFVIARIVNINGDDFLLEISGVLPAYKKDEAYRFAVAKIIQNPELVYLDNPEKQKEIEDDVAEIYDKFVEFFGTTEVITTNKNADDLIGMFNDFAEEGKKGDFKPLITEPEEYKYFDVSEFNNNYSNFLENSLGGFSSHKEIYDVGIIYDKELGLYAIPFYGTFNKIFEVKDYTKIVNYDSCIKYFLTKDKYSANLIKMVADKHKNFMEIVNAVLAKNYTLDELLRKYKRRYLDNKIISSTTVLYRSNAFSKTLGIIEDNETKPKIDTTQKIGRNDPCPCGSGKKYKKCCGANL